MAVGSSVILLLLLVTTSLAVRRYHAELKDAERELRMLDLLLASDTERSLKSISLLLDGIADQLPFRVQDGGTSATGQDDDAATHAFLRARAAGLPQLDALSIVGADGRLLNFSRTWPVPDIRLDDRTYFKALRDHAFEGPYLTEPVVNRGSGTATVYVAKRLQDAEGGFEGLLLGAIELGYFERFYALLHLESGSEVVLQRNDGAVLARYPPLPAKGSDEARREQKSGVTEAAWTDGEAAGAARLMVSEPIEEFPVHIDVSRPVALILHDWRREVLAIGSFTLLAILCVAMMMWALVRRFRAYEAVATAAAERERAILARQEVEEALRQSQKMEAIGQLTGGVAHDFNNLLTVIGSSVELLRRHDLDAERRTRYVDAIADASSRAARLTRQLLAFARRQALKPETFDVAVNVRGIGQMIDRLTGSRVSVVLSLPPEPCYVHADASQFDTAIVNLAVNARDAMPEGGRLTIAVERILPLVGPRAAAQSPDAFVAVIVSDTGTGIAPELRERVFEPFFTTKGVGKGTGLGLSQVIGFARQSGGDVLLASEPGRGTTFTLKLPRSEVDLPVAGSCEDVETVVDGRGARILLVDDDPEVARLSAQLLRELKYFVVVVNSAEEALDSLDQDDGFDAVVSDVVMAGMDGLTLARALRELYPDLPVLLCTGFSAALAEEGARDFALLHKPFSIEDLARELHAVRNHRRIAAPPPFTNEAEIGSGS